ncbi:MAG: MBL fold metallo-hydrolase [Verrucomicrobia bacterium]|nr:MBL fold metallo-hydrolase [Verrucomicrobiota bacterium]
MRIRSIFGVFLLACGLTACAWGESKATPVTLTVLYDNQGTHESLTKDWGFSCLIRGLDKVILFDTGAKGPILVENARRLGVNLSEVDIVVLSHAHGDHAGGLGALLEQVPKAVVYLPPDPSPIVRRQTAARTAQVFPAAQQNRELCPGAILTGVLGEKIKEHALALRSPRGWVILTGCAHPGIERIVEKVADSIGGRIHLIAGGFHLLDKTPAEVEAVAARLKELKVQKAAPSHCTGASAVNILKAKFGADFVSLGLGVTVVID